MRRADRLFQIIQILRRSSSPITAAALAAELETSKRSVYRDIASLIGQRALIRGEGVGRKNRRHLGAGPHSDPHGFARIGLRSSSSSAWTAASSRLALKTTLRLAM